MKVFFVHEGIHTWGILHLTKKPVFFLPCSTGIDLACGPCSSPVAPFLPLKQQSPRTSCYRTSLPWLPISANMWSDWNGQPQVSQAGPEAKTLLHSQVCSGHVSSLFSRFIWSSRSAEILRLSLHDLYLYMTLPSGKPRSCYSILLQLIFLNLTENKTAFLLVLFHCVEKLPWSASAV